MHKATWTTLISLGLSGCGFLGGGGLLGGLGGGDDDTGGIVDEEVAPADAPVGTCADDLSATALEEQLALFVALRESTLDVAAAAAVERNARVLAAALPRTLLLQPDEVRAPSELRWVGEGRYIIDIGSVAMDVLVTWDGGALDGQPVAHDLFDASNYFTGLVALTDASAGALTVRYDEAGPLAGLLGLGDDFASGDVVTLAQLEAPLFGVTFTYEADLDQALNGAVLNASLDGEGISPAAFRATTAARKVRGRNDATGQRIEAAPLTLTESVDGIDANLTVEITGDTLGYEGAIEVTNGVAAKAETWCPAG